MNFNDVYFKQSFFYQVHLVDKIIKIIRETEDEKRKCAFMNLLFKMMKDIVKKNIYNFLNLLRKTPLKNELPEINDLVSECFIIMNKCVERFILDKNYNFYFYYNKSLSRKFFRDYQKELKKGKENKLSEIKEIKSSNNEDYFSLEILLEKIKLTPLEKKICYSRLSDQKTRDFLKENSDITSFQYTKSLKNIQKILIFHKIKIT